MSKSQRLFDLMQILRRYRLPVSGAQLALEAGVSLRTIRRDVASLQAIGANIEGEAGVGYVLKPGFLLPPLMFSEEELSALVLGAQWVRQQTDGGLAQAAQDVLAKVDAVLPLELKISLYDTPFYVSDWHPHPDSLDLTLLRRAMHEQRKVILSYRDAKDESADRVIWPISLGFDRLERYIAGWCELRQDFRLFRADRIKSATLLPEHYPGRRGDLIKQWRAQVERGSNTSHTENPEKSRDRQ